MNTDLTVKLYNAVREANEPRVFDSWHASSIAECPRSHYFKRMGVPSVNEPTGAKILRWGVGHKMEEAIRPYLLGLYPNLKSNIRIDSKELGLTGEYDNYDPDSKQLIEIKSVHPFAVKHLEIDGKPYLHHLLQNHAYGILLGKERVETITFVYIALDGRLTAFSVEPSDEYYTNVERRLEALNEALETKTPPDCICTTDHPLYQPVMQYCDYKQEDSCCSLDLLKEKNE